MNERQLNAEIRNEFGKNATNRVRAGGYIPAILYSHGTSEALKVPAKEFSTLFKGHISESILIDLKIQNKKEVSEQKVFVKDYLLDPVSEQVLHLDFYKVTADEKIRTMVKLITEGTPAGVRAGGVLEIHERELEIECLPKDMPEQIVVNVSGIEIGQSLHIKDLNLGDQIKFMDSADRVIAAVITPHIQEEAVVETDEAVETAPEAAPKTEE
jgi:large subunit ribosomal protein L25